MIPYSNFSSSGSVPVGSTSGINGFGACKMVGNAAEWCWNQTGDGMNYIMGGGWDYPKYRLIEIKKPSDRSTSNGFRCMKRLSVSSLSDKLFEPIEYSTPRDYSKEKPVTDEFFKIFRGLYHYDKTELNAKIEFTDETPENWTMEKITYDAVYGNERIITYLFLPKNGKPPYQTVIHHTGGQVIRLHPSEILANLQLKFTDFVMKSGRALMYPVYKGHFERKDDFTPGLFYEKHTISNLYIKVYKDLGRTIDYLETRNDIDSSNLTYYGQSYGATIGQILVPLEKRIKVCLLLSGGLINYNSPPQCDPINFITRITIPTLMINGQYDTTFPLEAIQIPMFQLLGTPEADKRHIYYETGHGLVGYEKEYKKEFMNWLDKYVGPVK